MELWCHHSWMGLGLGTLFPRRANPVRILSCWLSFLTEFGLSFTTLPSLQSFNQPLAERKLSWVLRETGGGQERCDRQLVRISRRCFWGSIELTKRCALWLKIRGLETGKSRRQCRYGI